MSLSETVQRVFFERQALPVAPTEVETVLRRLWAEGRQGEQAVTRVCMANLVVAAGTQPNADQATEAVTRITATHLVRAIVLIGDETSETAEVQAWLSAHCQPAKASGPRVCCEQVTLRATGEAAERLPSAVLPLLAPDLPVVVWWMGDPPFGAPVFEQLIDAADRLVVDTTSFQDPTFSLTRLAALVRMRSDQIAVSDLNWARLTPWQDQLAQAFDSPDRAPYLERLERLTLRYLRQPEVGRVDPEKALLLAGWFLNRLGWKQPPSLARVAVGHFRGRLRRAGRELLVEIAPREVAGLRPTDDRSGMLLSVEARAGHGGPEAAFQVERCGDDLEMLATTITLPGIEPLVSTRRQPRRGVADLLAADLERLDHDYLFEAALELAAHIGGAMHFLPR